MFGVDTTEFIIVAIAALLFIGPKELPGAMRTVGRWIGKVRGMARHFSAGIDAVIREAELEEMEKSWREENDRIMRDYPAVDYQPEGEAPAPMLADRTAESANEASDEPPLPLDLPPGGRELP